MKKIMVCLFLFTACQNLEKKAEYNIQGDTTTAPGYVSVFQTATSDTETTINIMRPHLAKLKYEVEGLGEQKIIQTVSGPKIFWKVDRIHIKGLKTGKPYRLNIKKRRKVVDWREFKTLDIKSKKAKFVVGSCMSDDFKFEHVRNKIWHRMMSQSPDFLMLLGDQVYVDSFDFVKRETATEFEIWRRYVDSFRKIPLFQMRQLVPIFAVWDDHDFGTNNSNKTFKARKAAEKVFTAFFGGVNIKGVFEGAKTGVFSSFDGFGHRFLLMDNRYFREPKKEAAYGHWGKDQHQWFKEKLSKSDKPLWLAHGGQFFAPATFVDR
ncbi:MAG: alkaline phosphatase D family protein, partial [Bdellovibrionales bacterium]|nr:alkaline phosphatase D family protein [Bdellovibrionales bacterium]